LRKFSRKRGGRDDAQSLRASAFSPMKTGRARGQRHRPLARAPGSGPRCAPAYDSDSDACERFPVPCRQKTPTDNSCA
jgi:hypothetical protein